MSKKTFLLYIFAVVLLVLVSKIVYSESASVSEKIKDMIYIEGGYFEMGSISSEAERDEQPVHKVYLDAFYIDKYEVSVKDYVKFLNDNGYESEEGYVYIDIWQEDSNIEYDYGEFRPKYGTENLPVNYVSWYGARDYAKWVGKRLPTEAEWEYAAKGKENYIYPWGNEWKEDYCNWDEGGKKDGFVGLAPIDSFKNGVSPFGLYNMAGNVWEWVEDYYNSYFFDECNKKGEVKNPVCNDNTGAKVLRGGGYQYSKSKESLRCTNRYGDLPNNYDASNGFRCAISAKDL